MAKGAFIKMSQKTDLRFKADKMKDDDVSNFDFTNQLFQEVFLDCYVSHLNYNGVCKTTNIQKEGAFRINIVEKKDEDVFYILYTKEDIETFKKSKVKIPIPPNLYISNIDLEYASFEDLYSSAAVLNLLMKLFPTIV